VTWRGVGWVVVAALIILFVVRFGLLGDRRDAARPAITASPAALPAVFVGDCAPDPAFARPAALNAASLPAAQWSAFGRPETGWAIYAPLAAHEIGTACPPWAEGFAKALGRWQAARGEAASGVMDEPTLKALEFVWLRRRPFVSATAHGACLPSPDPQRLSQARPDEGYEGKAIQLRTGALDAYRRMVAAARAEAPTIAADHRLLTIFSGYRDPAADAVRCAQELDCGASARASCSAHRTGLAMDIFLGAAPGYPPESSADPNRLYQSQSAAYRWMVANAGRFGFVSYPFEPWHWEWTGEAP
jgi:D-alanyl-D-alanine carboxypeptidase